MAATDEARRPRTRPSASTTYHVLWISETFGENVRTRPIFRYRVVGETASGPASWGGLNGPGGPESRRTRIGPLAGGGKPPPVIGGGRGSIGDRDQAEPERRGGIGHAVAGHRPQPLHDAGGVLPPPSDLDEAPHQGADHLMAEGAGRDLETEEPGLPGPAVGVARLGPLCDVPAGRRAPPDQGSAGVAPYRTPAEGAEVVGAQEDVGSGPHGAEVEGVAHVPGHRRQQRVRSRGVPHQVAVAAGGGRAAGVEVRPDGL